MPMLLPRSYVYLLAANCPYFSSQSKVYFATRYLLFL